MWLMYWPWLLLPRGHLPLWSIWHSSLDRPSIEYDYRSTLSKESGVFFQRFGFRFRADWPAPSICIYSTVQYIVLSPLRRGTPDEMSLLFVGLSAQHEGKAPAPVSGEVRGLAQAPTYLFFRFPYRACLFVCFSICLFVLFTHRFALAWGQGIRRFLRDEYLLRYLFASYSRDDIMTLNNIFFWPSVVRSHLSFFSISLHFRVLLMFLGTSSVI